jgi:hypothetical protein
MINKLAIIYKNQWVYVQPDLKENIVHSNGVTYLKMSYPFRIYEAGVTNTGRFQREGKVGDYLGTNLLGEYFITTRAEYNKTFPTPITPESQKYLLHKPRSSKLLNQGKDIITEVVRKTKVNGSNIPSTPSPSVGGTGGIFGGEGY